ncbi:MAG: OmpA family protein [Epsilonproteobacteria bacterium]|nr:OmpA family protein [Campylobacterota bacterium]
MKKLILIPALMLGTMAMAKQPKYEISPMIGYNLAEGNLDFKDHGHMLGGLELQFNSPDSKVSPEFSIMVSPSADYEGGKDTNIYRGAFNGVYTFDNVQGVVPFAKAGFGYEKISSENADNKSAAFLDAGAGFKMFFTENIALKIEAIYMAKLASHNAGTADNNLVGMAGLTFAFGGEEPAPIDGDDDNDGVLNSMDKCPNTISGTSVDAKGCKIDGDDDKDGILNSVDECPTTPAGEAVDTNGCSLDSDKDGVVNAMDRCPTTPIGTTVDANGCKVDGDDDNDGVLNSMDKCPATPAGEAVDAKGCKIDGDDDNDGVLNSMDKCPSTPKNTEVDAQGCMLPVNLHINFQNNSYKVDKQSDRNIQKFVNYLKTRNNINAEIIGYTDSIGKASYNKKLSQRRANAVKAIIESKGISASRITATGMGEANPVATNSTRAGRALNRRIEAKVSHK